MVSIIEYVLRYSKYHRHFHLVKVEMVIILNCNGIVKVFRYVITTTSLTKNSINLPLSIMWVQPRLCYIPRPGFLFVFHVYSCLYRSICNI